MIEVEVAHVAPQATFLRCVRVPADATARDAIEASGVLREVPGIELARLRVGIHARLAGLDAPLAHGDRVELYRPLVADPKDRRRRQAERQGTARRR